MSRLTISLTEARYRALKEASAQRDKTIGQRIDESLEFYGIKSREDARDLVLRARSKLADDQALAVAQDQVQTVRLLPGQAGMRGRVLAPGEFVAGIWRRLGQ